MGLWLDYRRADIAAVRGASGDLLELRHWGSVAPQLLDHVVNIVPHVFHPLSKCLQSAAKLQREVAAGMSRLSRKRAGVSQGYADTEHRHSTACMLTNKALLTLPGCTDSSVLGKDGKPCGRVLTSCGRNEQEFLTMNCVDVLMVIWG